MNIEHYYEQQGSGLPLVFIHGSYASTATWKKMIEHLAQRYHCISIKLPGHCGTADPDDFSAPTMETELSVIEQVVALTTDRPIHLVGHSYGGVVALAQALKGSLALERMTLFEPVAAWVLDSVGDMTNADIVRSFLTTYRRDVLQQLPYACGQVIDFWGGQGAFEQLPQSIRDSMALLALNNLRHWDICMATGTTLEDLQQLAVPTRIVCGDQSNPLTRVIAGHLCAAIPDCDLRVINGASHFLVTSHSADCVAAMSLS